MANWDNLKAAIQDVIKENGNEEITGEVLQNTLLSIVNNLGENATFAGLATPTTNPGTPDGVIFYVATQQGTYQYFNNLVVNKGETAIFLYKTNWTKISIAVAPAVPNVLQNSGASSTDVMSQGAVTAIVGIDDVPQFSDQTSYKVGDFVRYTGLIFKFTAAHSAGQWKGTDTTPSSLAEYIKAAAGNTKVKAVTLEKAPYLMHMHYYPPSSIWQISRGKKIILLDVSNVSSIQFADNIPLPALSPTAGLYIIWLDESKSVINSRNISAGLKVDLPSNAKYVFLDCNFDDNDLIGNYWLSVTLRDNVGFSEEQLYTIPGVWDGRTYTINKTFFPVGTVGTNTELVDNNTASLYVRKCPNINRFRYTNSETEDVRELYFNGTNRDNIWEWEQSEGNVHKEYYLRSKKEESAVSFFFEEDEIMCNRTVHISPRPSGGMIDWVNIVVLDKGSNKMHESINATNKATEFSVAPYAHSIRNTRLDLKDFMRNPASLWIDEKLSQDYTPATSANLLTDENLVEGQISYSDNQLSVNRGTNKTAVVAVYVPVKPNTEYCVLDYFPNNLSNSSMMLDTSVVALNADKQVIKAYAKSDITKLNGGSAIYNTQSLYSGLLGRYAFTTPENAAYVIVQMFRAVVALPNTIYDYPAIICEETQIVAAVKETYRKVKSGVITGVDMEAAIKPCNKVIWLLGDSIALGAGQITALQGGSNGGWTRYFIDIAKPYAVYNYAMGGYTLTDNVEAGPDGIITNASNSFIARLEELITKYQSQTAENPILPPDYLFICGCANDMGKVRDDVSGEFDGHTYVSKTDLANETINPGGLDYNAAMERIFITDLYGDDNKRKLINIQAVPMFKIAGAVRYIVQRVGTLFPACKFVISTNIINTMSTAWDEQENCNNELRWIAHRLSIPVIDVARRANTVPLWDYAKNTEETQTTRRFLNDNVHFYGSTDTENQPFNTAAAMYIGNVFAEEFKRICHVSTMQDIEVFDYPVGKYPHDKNVIFNS